VLKLKDIDFSYDRKHKILTDISFAIRQGEIIALAGRNGSGKTTLTRLIMGLLNADTGSIKMNGQDVTKFRAADMAKHIGYVFQNPDRQLFASTVREEIIYGPTQLGFSRKEIDLQLEAVLQATDLVDFAELSPQTLPRGIKQRLSIASALAVRPQLLILDEPTTGQDCRERTKLLRLMRKLNLEGMTVLIVTHDMDIIAEHAKTLIVLENGKIKFNGVPKALFANEKKTVELGLELPEAVRISRDLGLDLCMTPANIYQKMQGRRDLHV
jgi:energy-coupling factor transport system ATP-binding protein